MDTTSGTSSLAFLLALSLLAAPAPGQRRASTKERIPRIRAAVESGDLGKAYALLREALARDPNDPELRRNLGACAFLLGQAFTRNGDPSRARALFREAARWMPADPKPWRALAESQIAGNRVREAESSLRRVLALDPERVNPRIDLARLLHRRGAYREAARLLRETPGGRARDPRLDRLLRTILADAELERDFAEKRGSRTRLRYPAESPEARRNADRLLALLEKEHERLRERLGFAPRERILVILYDRERFVALESPASWARAWFDGKVRLPLEEWSRRRRVFRALAVHEMTHAFLARRIPGLSPWLHEGLAQWCEGKDPASGRSLLRRDFPSWKLLDHPFVQQERNETATLLYAASLEMVSFLLAERGERGLLAFCERLRRLGPEAEDLALRKVYGFDRNGLRDRVLASLGAARPGRE